MTTSTRREPTPVSSGLDLSDAHRHTTRCYWDLRQCRWRCAASGAGGAPLGHDPGTDDGC